MRKSILMGVALATMLFGAGAEAGAAGLEARIDVATQTMTVSREGRVLYRWKVSTARKGYVTPRGSYRPQRLHRMWYSRKYDNSPMPYSVFYHGGYAIHGTGAVRQLGRPASHGCVRLHPANAKTFFALVQKSGKDNTTISIVR